MENKLQIFNNPEFGQIRTIQVKGKEYFMALDVVRVLKYNNPQQAIRTNCPNRYSIAVRLKTATRADGTDATRIFNVNFIPESDLYRLIVRSRLPAAKQFERWIFEEVLPTLRQQGTYQIKQPSVPIQNLRSEPQEQPTRQELLEQIENLIADRDRWQQAYLRIVRNITG